MGIQVIVETYEPIDGYSLTQINCGWARAAATALPSTFQGHSHRGGGCLATVALSIDNTGQIVGYGFNGTVRKLTATARHGFALHSLGLA